MSETVERAQAAQDRIGWSPMPAARDGDTEFASGTLDLARVVVDLAREVRRLQALVEPATPPTYDEVECCASGSCEVCKR